MDLYSYFNSSTSYRVRIALALKSVDFSFHGVDIRIKEHHHPDYIKKNPGAGVPLLVDEGFALGQSMAIIDYLDQKYPEPRLIPEALHDRARVLEMANLIASDMHPINNLRVLRYLVGEMGLSDDKKNQWYAHWIEQGFTALEKMLERVQSGSYCYGNRVSLADVCLVPQYTNAARMKCDLSPYPRIKAVYDHCVALPAFQKAAPANQPDYSP